MNGLSVYVVGSSVLVFGPLMLLWAVILVPMWLRKHDEAVETKSVDKFSTAMRTLSRRGPRDRATSRDVLVPSARRDPVISGGRAPSAAARRERAAKAARMRRRRTASIALLGFLVVVVLATVVGAAPIWLPLVVLVVTGGFVWQMRVQTVREARLERRRRQRARTAPAPVRRPAARVPAAPVWPVGAERRAAAPVRAEVAFTDTVVVAELDTGWTPNPTVLPTYVTAPPATSVPRVIDLTHPGSWSAAHMLDAVAASNLPDPDEIFDGRAEGLPVVSADASDAELFDQYEVEHEAVAETVAGSTAQPFLDDDAIFDQTEDDEFLAFLDRRASGS